MAEDNLIDVACDRIKFDKDKLEINELARIEVDCFKLSDFWAQFGTAVQALSNEVTKVGFMCGNKPYPTIGEVGGMLCDVMQYYSMMRDLYLVLPEEVGEQLFKAVTAAVLSIMSALLELVRSLKDLSENGAKERLMLTGTFWDACKAVEALPRDSLQATLKVLDEETALATDAQQELTATIEEDRINLNEAGEEEDSEMWTDTERDLATKSVGLVKVTAVCLQRLRRAVRDFGSCSTPQHCAQLDHITRRVADVSPALDNFVSELYHPIDFSTARHYAGVLAEVLRGLLGSVQGSHCEQGLNTDLVNNLLHFICHNHHKVDPQASDPVPELSNLTFTT